MFPIRATILATVLCLAGVVPALAAEPNSPTGVDTALLRAFLAASGIDEPERSRQFEIIRHEIDGLVARLGDGKPSYRRARKLHRILHRDYLSAYDREADSLPWIFAQGQYNCLSATQLYGLVADALGYETEVLSVPGHLFLRLSIDGKPIEIETTVPHGFDPQRGPVAAPMATQGRPAPRRQESSSEEDAYADETGSVSLREAVGFAWLNSAWRALDHAESVRAAQAVREAASYLPGLEGKAEGAHHLLARAFREVYESGRYDEAYAVAAIDVGLFPGRTTSRDRILAVALKQVERACEANEPTVAVGIIEEVEQLCAAPTDLRLFERRTYPLVVVAAVRLQAWDLARLATERYAGVESDLREVERLRAWVELRQATNLTAGREAVCPEPTADGLLKPGPY